ncbi:MAG: exo-alpha-sialidase [Thermoguttaceae bacterium]|nr:exo-alpha-sialidase [Thermoguttaceae bacterium]
MTPSSFFRFVFGCAAAVCAVFLSSARVNAQGAVPTVDISQDAARQVVIAAGTPDVYQGHPYLVKNPDDSMLVVWCVNHGGHAGPIAKSVDGGLTWTRLDKNAPDVFQTHINCPSIYRLVDANGKAWHWVFTSQPWMARIVSGDGGETWEELAPLGFANVMAFSSIVPKNPGVQDGKYIGFYHHRRAANGKILNREPPEKGRLEVVISETDDAGFTWSEPRTVGTVEEKDLCEPFAFWSPNSKEICCLMRENRHKGRSMVMFSEDHGQTWSTPKDTSWELTGDRHMGVYVDNDRLFIAFRDQAIGSETRGHFVGWVGSYEDIKNSQPGDYRVKLLHSYAKPNVGDCGYPGVAILKDKTVVALTYIKYKDDENKHSVVETRFTMDELDRLADEAKKQKDER